MGYHNLVLSKLPFASLVLANTNPETNHDKGKVHVIRITVILIIVMIIMIITIIWHQHHKNMISTTKTTVIIYTQRNKLKELFGPGRC